MVVRFSDIRIVSVLEETLPYRNDFLKREGLEQKVISHILSCKQKNIMDNKQLLCFYVLKYAYFLRNKYFHAEKATPVFVLKETSELQELSEISLVMKYFLFDLIRCNEEYL